MNAQDSLLLYVHMNLFKTETPCPPGAHILRQDKHSQLQAASARQVQVSPGWPPTFLQADMNQDLWPLRPVLTAVMFVHVCSEVSRPGAHMSHVCRAARRGAAVAAGGELPVSDAWCRGAPETQSRRDQVHMHTDI